MPILVSLGQRFPEPEDPLSKLFSAPGTCTVHPLGTETTKDRGSRWGSRDLQTGHPGRPRAEVCAAPRGTWHVAPTGPRPAPSFRRIGASNGTTPVPIGPVWAPRVKMLGHTDRQTDKHIRLNFFSPTPQWEFPDAKSKFWIIDVNTKLS